MKRSSQLKESQGGFTLIELLVVVAILGIISAIAIASVQGALRKSQVNAVAAESRVLYDAFMRFYVDNSNYPWATTSPSFQLDTFEPLRGAGYYTGNVAESLVNNRADSYDSPDDNGTNGEFWLLMTVEADPSVQFLVCNSDNTPIADGTWLDGIYLVQNGTITPIDKYKP